MQTKSFDVYEALLATGRAEFLAHGFEKASLRQICRRANVTTGAFYSYFEKKEDLFAALVEPMLQSYYPLYHSAIGSEMTDFCATESNELRIIEFVMMHRAEFKLLFDAAAGTKYESFKEDLLKEFDRSHQQFFDRYAGRPVDPALVKLMVRMRFQEYMGFIYGEYEMEKVRELARQAFIFFKAGVKEMMKEITKAEK